MYDCCSSKIMFNLVCVHLLRVYIHFVNNQKPIDSDALSCFFRGQKIHIKLSLHIYVACIPRHIPCWEALFCASLVLQVVWSEGLTQSNHMP